MRKRRGFSIVELLVVIGVIGVLLALVMPAVLRSRGAARRVQCVNNLHQLGIALHHYHETHSLLPPAAVWAGPPGEPLGGGEAPVGVLDNLHAGQAGRMSANWLIMLLPQLDQASLYTTYDSTVPVDAPGNLTVRETALSVLMCASDPHNASAYSRGSSDTNLYARGNYAMNFGPDRLCIEELDPENCRGGFHVDSPELETENQQVWGSGLGGFNKSFSFLDVTGGLSNVVIIDEIRAGPHRKDSRGAWPLGFAGSSITMGHALADDGNADAYGPNNQNRSADDIVGCPDVVAEKGAGWLREQGMPCYENASLANQATARSLHEGGVHVLRCDGSAGFVSDHVDLELWYHQHRRDGGAGAADEF